MRVRLQKYIADIGICSRRKAEELIKLGKVKVNGKTVVKMGIKIDIEKDKVEVFGRGEFLFGAKAARCLESNVYIALNKPDGYITSVSGRQGRSVIDLLTKENHIGRVKQDLQARVYPAGRLDKDSEGLVLLTNDGKLTDILTHPRYGHEKEYEVTIDKPLAKDAKVVLAGGMKIGDEFARGIIIKREVNKGKRSVVTVILSEGKNRQIRKMFGRLGYHIISLKRTRIGKLKLGALPVGRWKFVKREHIL